MLPAFLHVAVRVNVSRQTISHWENGRAQPDPEFIVLLSRALDYSFQLDDAPAPVQPDAIPAAEPPVAEAPVMDASAAQPALAAAPVRKPRGKVLVLAGAVLCLLALGLLLPQLLPKPAAEITIGPLSPIAYLEKGDAFGKDSVQVIVRFYENDRIDDIIATSKSRRMLPGAMITMIWRTTRPLLPPAPMKAARRASIAGAKAAVTRHGKRSESFCTSK